MEEVDSSFDFDFSFVDADYVTDMYCDCMDAQEIADARLINEVFEVEQEEKARLSGLNMLEVDNLSLVQENGISNYPVSRAVIVRAIATTSEHKPSVFLKQHDSKNFIFDRNLTSEVLTMLHKTETGMDCVIGFSSYNVKCNVADVQPGLLILKEAYPVRFDKYYLMNTGIPDDSVINCLERIDDIGDIITPVSRAIISFMDDVKNKNLLDAQILPDAGGYSPLRLVVGGAGMGKTYKLCNDVLDFHTNFIKDDRDNRKIFVLAPTNIVLRGLQDGLKLRGIPTEIYPAKSTKVFNFPEYAPYVKNRKQFGRSNCKVILMTVAIYLRFNYDEAVKPLVMVMDEEALLAMSISAFLYHTTASYIWLYGDPFQNSPFSNFTPEQKASPNATYSRSFLEYYVETGGVPTYIAGHSRATGPMAARIYNYFYKPYDAFPVDRAVSGVDDLKVGVIAVEPYSSVDPLVTMVGTSKCRHVNIIAVNNYLKEHFANPANAVITIAIVTPYSEQHRLYSALKVVGVNKLKVYLSATVQGCEADLVIYDPVVYGNSQFEAFNLKSMRVVLTRPKKFFLLVGRPIYADVHWVVYGAGDKFDINKLHSDEIIGALHMVDYYKEILSSKFNKKYDKCTVKYEWKRDAVVDIYKDQKAQYLSWLLIVLNLFSDSVITRVLGTKMLEIELNFSVYLILEYKCLMDVPLKKFFNYPILRHCGNLPEYVVLVVAGQFHKAQIEYDDKNRKLKIISYMSNNLDGVEKLITPTSHLPSETLVDAELEFAEGTANQLVPDKINFLLCGKREIKPRSFKGVTKK